MDEMVELENVEEPQDVLEALKDISSSLTSGLVFLAKSQEKLEAQLKRIADALDPDPDAGVEGDQGLDDEVREQVGNLMSLMRRERRLHSNVLPFFESLVTSGFVDISNFLEQHDELPYKVTTNESTGHNESRGLQVAIGRAVSEATGQNAPASYRQIGYYEDYGEDDEIIAFLQKPVADAVRRLI